MMVEVKGDVAMVTLLLALRTYGLVLRSHDGGVRIERGPDAHLGDMKATQALAALCRLGDLREAAHG